MKLPEILTESAAQQLPILSAMVLLRGRVPNVTRGVGGSGWGLRHGRRRGWGWGGGGHRRFCLVKILRREREIAIGTLRPARSPKFLSCQILTVVSLIDRCLKGTESFFLGAQGSIVSS